MTVQLTFEDLQNICQALGEFANARSQENPDKDVILTVRKINGRDVLQTCRCSNMSWFSRFFRWFGCGDSTLRGVAYFLERHEPYFSKGNSTISYYYTEDAVGLINKMDKQTLKKLKEQKLKGFEVFKKCLSSHNKRISQKVYMLSQDYGQIKLSSWSTMQVDNMRFFSPNPMGVFQNEEKGIKRERYQPPIIDPNEFLYLDPFFRKARSVAPHILGFCYEYGLGVKENLDLAFKYYQQAINDEYSACYNLARLLLNRDQTDEAISLLKRAESDLLEKLDYLKSSSNNLDKQLRKALVQVYFVLIEAYRRIDEHQLMAEYQEKMDLEKSCV